MAKDAPRTAAVEDLLSPEAKESLRHLELLARRTVDGLLHGIHHSRRIGVSSDFDHHKNYQPGDPIRHVDWKASARHDRFYVKRYREDTSLTVHLVVDRSGSMLQASDGPSKYLQACRVAACLAYLVVKERDSVGMVLASSDGTKWLPPSSTQRHLVTMLRTLVSNGAAAADDLETCLRTVQDRGLRRGLIVLISDLMFDPEPVQRRLGAIQAQGHEVLLVQLRDPTEEDFPFNRWVQFEDLENSAVRHRVDTVPLKRIYREEYQALLRDWQAWAAKYGVHLVTFRTEQHVDKVLSEYIAFRGRMA